nr:NUDIX domain-containing protein [uncultured Oscillibacter sp.]
MVEVKFYDHAEDALLKFAVILARTGGKWVFCRHRDRDTYEIPGGHREPGEDILSAAKRELREETGAVEFTIRPVCAYSVRGKTGTHKSAEEETFGMLFMADITSFEALHCEIEAILVTDRPVDRWTYPLIQPRLLAEARNRGFW